MPDFNLNYGYASDALPVGTVADSRHTHTSTCDAAAELILPGQPVGWDGLLPAAVGTPMRGVARWTTTMIQDDATGDIGYKIGDVVPLLSFGPIWVNVVGAVTAGAKAYAIISGAGKGKFTATSGVTTTTDPVGLFETATAGDGQAILFVQYNTSTPVAP